MDRLWREGPASGTISAMGADDFPPSYSAPPRLFCGNCRREVGDGHKPSDCIATLAQRVADLERFAAWTIHRDETRYDLPLDATLETKTALRKLRSETLRAGLPIRLRFETEGLYFRITWDTLELPR